MTSQEMRRSLPALIAGVTVTIVFFAVLSIMLTAAGSTGLDLSAHRTSGWIALVYALPMIPSLVLTLRYRMPLLLTGNVFALIFFATLGHRFGFAELSAAAIVAGAIVLVVALLGLTGQLARWIPAPIVNGLIAGAVMPFVVNIFTSLSTSAGVEVPIVVGSAVLAYLVSQEALGTRLPAILPAFVVGFLAAAVTGKLGGISASLSLPGLEPIRPVFTWSAVLTVSPVLLALMTVQSNVPSIVYLREQGFRPPARVLDLVSGIATMLGSLFGPITVSLALPPVLVTAGPTAGERSLRYRAVFPPIAAGIGIALFASVAVDLAVLVPPALLLTIAGLALTPALVAALRAIASGPLVLGPLFAFAIALSTMKVAGLGSFFWSLVLGTLVSFVFERDGWRRLQSGAAVPHEDQEVNAAVEERRNHP